MAIEIKHRQVTTDDGNYQSEFWVDLPSGERLFFYTIDHCWWDDTKAREGVAEKNKTQLMARLQELKGLL